MNEVIPVRLIAELRGTQELPVGSRDQIPPSFHLGIVETFPPAPCAEVPVMVATGGDALDAV